MPFKKIDIEDIIKQNEVKHGDKFKKYLKKAEREYSSRKKKNRELEEYDEFKTFLTCKANQCDIDDSVQQSEYFMYIRLRTYIDIMRLNTANKTTHRAFMYILTPMFILNGVLWSICAFIRGGVLVESIFAFTMSCLSGALYIRALKDLKKNEEMYRPIADKIRKLTKI